MRTILALAFVLAGSAGFALAGFAAPEIDASSGIAAIALISGGVLVLRSRRRAK